MVNFGPLPAEIVSLVWGTPANFNGFRVLAALLHGSPVVGVSKLCGVAGVEQRAPPVFGRATITLFFFYFPRLVSAATDWMSAILPHMVWP